MDDKLEIYIQRILSKFLVLDPVERDESAAVLRLHALELRQRRKEPSDALIRSALWRRLLDLLRRNKTARARLVPLLDEDRATYPWTVVDLKLDAQKFWTGDPESAHILALAVERSHEELAEELGCSRSTAIRRLRAAQRSTAA